MPLRGCRRAGGGHLQRGWDNSRDWGYVHASGWAAGEGELEGTVVTCPWHGAQFEVTTGQVVGPPAGQSVATYKVVVEGEEIQVDIS